MSFIFVESFLSQITPVRSLHFDHTIATLLSTSLLALPLLSIVDARSIFEGLYTVGKLTVSVSMYLFILTWSVSHVVCMCLVFALLTLSPSPPYYLHRSSPRTASFLNFFRDHIYNDHEQQLTSAETRLSATSISISLAFPALVMTLVLHLAYMSRIVFM